MEARRMTTHDRNQIANPEGVIANLETRLTALETALAEAHRKNRVLSDELARIQAENAQLRAGSDQPGEAANLRELLQATVEMAQILNSAVSVALRNIDDIAFADEAAPRREEEIP
jgi:septal ring factor EnvC (AmiA/AmiB activator)